MAKNIHAIRDEIVRGRVGMVIALNELHELDPEAAYLSYLLCLQEIQNHFKGSQPAEDVEEKGNLE